MSGRESEMQAELERRQAEIERLALGRQQPLHTMNRQQLAKALLERERSLYELLTDWERRTVRLT